MGLLCARPLAVKLEGVLGASDIRELVSVRANALASETADPRDLLQRRSFGIGPEGKDGGGHEILFLHEHLDAGAPNIRKKMLEWAQEADNIAGWGAIGSELPAARCFELISYHRRGNESDLTGAHDDNLSEPGHRVSASPLADDIGWHSDGATLITTAAMLSSRDEYKGGIVELKEGMSSERYELSLGDVLAWRGWTQHRVSPVIEGKRDIFIAEWWLGADCADSLEPRGRESLEEVQRALEIDPSSSVLHRYLGEALCLQQPCGRPETAARAEAEYRQALDLEPGDPVALHALGSFLVSGGGFGWLEGVRMLREAHALNPHVVAAPNDDLVAMENLWTSAKRFVCGVVAICCLLLLLRLLEKLQDSDAAREKKD